MNIFVGNLAHEVTDEDLRGLFETYGEVASANAIKDKFTGKSRGFGFVEMPVKSAAQTAITELNGKEVKGRAINVNEARPRTESRSGGPGRRPGGGGGGRRPDGGGGGRRRSY
jgi:RNA recognition motif-containing protein